MKYMLFLSLYYYILVQLLRLLPFPIRSYYSVVNEKYDSFSIQIVVIYSSQRILKKEEGGAWAKWAVLMKTGRGKEGSRCDAKRCRRSIQDFYFYEFYFLNLDFPAEDKARERAKYPLLLLLLLITF